MNPTIAKKFNNISFSIICVICVLLPLIFLPGNISGIGAVKGVVLYTGVLLAGTLWLVSQFIEGSIRVPRHRVLLGLLVWIGLVLISALASKNVSVSLWGRGFAMDSFATVLILGILSIGIHPRTTSISQTFPCFIFSIVVCVFPYFCT